jgi:hypothetical protein
MTRELSKLDKKILNYAKELNGISYFEWGKLKHLLDMKFKSEQNKLNKELKLTCSDDMEWLMF